MERNSEIMGKLAREKEEDKNVSLSKFININFNIFEKSGKTAREIYDFLKEENVNIGSFSSFKSLYSKSRKKFMASAEAPISEAQFCPNLEDQVLSELREIPTLQERGISKEFKTRDSKYYLALPPVFLPGRIEAIIDSETGAKNFAIERKVSKDMKNLIYVGGSKGGTGKSMVSMALVNYFRTMFPQDEILLVETDSSNPDVGRLYRQTEGVIPCGLLLNEEDSGWMKMVDDIAKTPARHIIINSMAASNLGIRSHGAILDNNILNGRLDVKFSVFWAMNRNKDSVVLLRDFLQWMKSATVYPILNLYFGKEEEFLFFRGAGDIQQMIVERGGRSLVFPSLNDLIADRLYTDEINLETLPSYLGLGMRTGLERWLSTTQEIFDRVDFAPVAND
jgi:cellulose biosynthesis protein BcsQ